MEGYMKKHITAVSVLAITVLCLAVVLSGCGGGGGSSESPGGGDPTIILSVTSTTPLNKVSGIPIQSTISVVFSKAVDTTSITESTFIITGETGTVAGTVAYNETSKTATFTPAAPFAKIKTYTATVTTGVKDADGNALAADYTWSFTTGPVFAAGYRHSLVVKSDGTVWAWGYNSYGQVKPELYVASTANEITSPVQITLPGAAVVSVAGGEDHSLALRNDGTVLAWGKNHYGQLGDGTHSTERALGPVQVKDLSGVIALAASRHSLALKSDGTVWAWGKNDLGALGDGTNDHRYAPVQVSGLSGVIAIAAGYDFSLALKSDGTVWAWGAKNNGQLGDGNSGGGADNYSMLPVQVTGLTNVTAISAGQYHSIALKNDGTVWAWGNNDSNAECGIAPPPAGNAVPVPVQVSSVSGIQAIAAGGDHNLALKDDGTVWAWGSDYYGQLGNGDVTSGSQANAVQVSLNAPALLAAGEEHSMAMMSDGTLFTWGNNQEGQLGYAGENVGNRTPAQIGVF